MNKLCKDCKWCLIDFPNFGGEYYKCTHPNFASLSDGKSKEFCTDMRTFLIGACGRSAWLFEPKE